jgi:hypothetical protein
MFGKKKEKISSAGLSHDYDYHRLAGGEVESSTGKEQTKNKTKAALIIERDTLHSRGRDLITKAVADKLLSIEAVEEMIRQGQKPSRQLSSNYDALLTLDRENMVGFGQLYRDLSAMKPASGSTAVVGDNNFKIDSMHFLLGQNRAFFAKAPHTHFESWSQDSFSSEEQRQKASRILARDRNTLRDIQRMLQ